MVLENKQVSSPEKMAELFEEHLLVWCKDNEVDKMLVKEY